MVANLARESLAKPTISTSEAREIVAANSRIATLQTELDALTGPPPMADLLAALDAAIALNERKFQHVLADALRGQAKLNPHAEWTDERAAEYGEHVLRGLLQALADDVLLLLVLPLLRERLRASIKQTRYEGDASPSMADRRKRAAKLKDQIAALRPVASRPLSAPDRVVVEKLTGRPT